MQAVILAAGLGIRLRPITENIPKPMILVGGKSILERTFTALRGFVDEALVVIGHKGDVIQNHFGTSFGNISIQYIEQPEPRGTAHALLCARPYLRKGQFLFLGGDDIFCADDLRKLLHGDIPTVLVSRSETPERFGVCLTGADGMLCGILEKHGNPPSNLVNTGAYLLAPDIFEIQPPVLPNGELNLAEQIGNWSQTRPVRLLEATYWYPINSHDELAIAEKALTLS